MASKKQLQIKPGRIARSSKSRTEQVASAQRTFRAERKKEGYRSIQVYMPSGLVEAIDLDARAQTLSRGQKLEEILTPIYSSKKKGLK